MRISLVPILFALGVAHTGHAIPHLKSRLGSETNEPQARSANTCADASLAKVISRGFAPAPVIHILNVDWAFEHSNTVNAEALFIDVAPAFRAWTSQQPFTVPLFRLGTANGQEYIYMIGPDASTPPRVAGFNTDVGIVAWVYDTPVCGSVPLLSTVFAAQTDHYYTTSADAHDGLIGAGWGDGGIVAYVLPLENN